MGIKFYKKWKWKKHTVKLFSVVFQGWYWPARYLWRWSDICHRLFPHYMISSQGMVSCFSENQFHSKFFSKSFSAILDYEVQEFHKKTRDHAYNLSLSNFVGMILRVASLLLLVMTLYPIIILHHFRPASQ